MLNRKRISYVALALVIVLALALIFYKNLSYEYEMTGEVINILDGSYTGASGYDVTQLQNGMYFEPTNDDPQLYFDVADAGQIGGLELVLGDTQGEFSIQVFYASAGESLSERHSVSVVSDGTSGGALIPLPLGEYSQLRIDIDGAFTLYEVNVCTGKMLASAYASDRTINKCLWYFPAVLIGFPLIYWAHGERRKRGEHLLFGAKTAAGREPHWDYMRISAAVLVILAHACSPMVTELEASGGADWKRLVLICGLTLGLNCNLIYVMLSGALLLNSKRDEGVAAFYIRRVSRVVIPLVAYYLLLLSLNNEVSFLPPKNIGAAFKRIVTGAPDAAPHLWLIYTIVACYLVTPFFRVMAAHLSEKMLKSLAIAIIVLNALTYYLPLFGMTFGASTFLAGWEGVFLLGYIMSRLDTSTFDTSGTRAAKRRGVGIAAVGVLAFIASVAAVYISSANMNYVYNCTPTMVLMSCAIFYLFVKNKNLFAHEPKSKPGKAVPYLVRMCSKYSYSIILIHWYVLFVIVDGRLHINALRYGVFGGIVATVVLTFVICLALAIVFDNTVVIVCSEIFGKIQRKFFKPHI